MVTKPGGTAGRTGIDGIVICGKTGTAQNSHGKDHSLFIAFAPKDNPKIAVAAIVENGGYGATWAAPICNLMIEKYLNRKNPEYKTKIPHLEKRMKEAIIQ
jgi:penicillin-binding protein 2